MITIKWSHAIVGLALVIGLLIGSHVQFTPTPAMAQPVPPMGQFSPTISPPPVAMQVYNNNVYIVRGNSLYIYKTMESPIFRDKKFPVLIGKTQIEMDTTTTNYLVPNYGAPNYVPPRNPLSQPMQPMVR
jgi:hypothetical protein